MDPSLQPYFQQIVLPAPDSHKGQNGKLLIIGGSELFHAASKWSLDVASKFVDMVFYSSVPSNNELVKEAKGEFWNGMVVPREQLEEYLAEADCVLIGPGMTRSDETEELTNSLLQKYPDKKWVIDAGALQMVDPKLLNEKCVVTPHYRELTTLFEKLPHKSIAFGDFDEKLTDLNDPFLPTNLDCVGEMAYELGKATLLIKGVLDYVGKPEETVAIPGGNAGMTKGGTGDVLAGLVAALYCTHDTMTSAVVASYVNKKAGEALSEQVGPYFNASDLVEAIPGVLWKELSAL